MTAVSRVTSLWWIAYNRFLLPLREPIRHGLIRKSELITLKTFGGYRLQARLGEGDDGQSYLALRSDGSTEVEVRDLSVARSDPARWRAWPLLLERLLQLDDEGAPRILETQLEAEPPFLVLEWVGAETLASRRERFGPFSEGDALAIGRTLAGTLAQAHRLGLIHGGIAPARVRLTEGGVPKLDFTAIPAQAVSGNRLESAARAEDVKALGSLLRWMLAEDVSRLSDTIETSLDSLIRKMLAPDPLDRPDAKEVADRLAGEEPGDHGSPPPLPSPTTSPGSWQGIMLGRYRLLEKLGEGGQGVVYRALDTSNDSVVALKTLRPEWASKPEVLRRFRKEARLLASINNPNVVNLLEHDEESGVGFLVMEYVTGKDLLTFIGERGKLDVATALALASEIARGLEDAHAQGIIHRDVKPANVLLIETTEGATPRVKLSDFGLARNVVDSSSMAMTEPGALLGTPLYMAPEQWMGLPVDSRTDVYALGVTLFHMLVGRAPFRGETREQLLSMHCHEAPPPIRQLVPEVSDGVGKLIECALAKSPDDRYPDAAALRRDLDRLTRGEPTDILPHPILPARDASRTRCFEFKWDLESTPGRLWPLVTNTDRLDRAIGFPPVKYAYVPDPVRGVRQFAEGRKAGMIEAWEEFPYEWVEPWRMGVYREYAKGPFRWLVSTVELAPRPGGGTTLTHKLQLEPRGWTSRLFSPIGVGVGFRATLDKVYRRIDAALMGKLGADRFVDPFEPTPELPRASIERLERGLDALASRGVEPSAVDRLGDLLMKGASQEVARIRPGELASRWGVDPETALTACLYAVDEALLVLLWDILCPKCRLSCEVADTLRAIREHGRCEACQLDFELDFAGSIELIFRAHPEIREADTGLYCSGGPAHAPHVPARVRVAPGERIELELMLRDGAYRVGGPQLPWNLRFKIQQGAISRRVELDLSRAPDANSPSTLASGGQVVGLNNPLDREFLVQVERESAREDALTAAQALSYSVFRDLFPGETLAPGRLCGVSSLTILVIQLCPFEMSQSAADARRFDVVYENLRAIEDAVRTAGGTPVKSVGEGLLASFSTLEDAIRLVLGLEQTRVGNESSQAPRKRFALDRGPAFMATLAGRLDYFGEPPARAVKLLSYAAPGELVVSSETATDESLRRTLEAAGKTGVMFHAGVDGFLKKYVIA